MTALDVELGGLIEVFCAETAENITTMEQALLAMEARGAAEPELLNALLRAAHTVKGNSAIVGYDAVAAAAHSMEDDLQQLRDGDLVFSGALVTKLLAMVDELANLVNLASGAQPGGKREEPAAAPVTRRPTLRIDTARLDTLLDLTGEITIARGRLSQLVSGVTAADSALATTLWQLEQLHAALQGEVMALRMVPLGPVLEAQHRAVRDVAVRLDKDVRVVIEGHDVEVDTRVAEQMRDPLTHMVRNAMDHGIETPAERVAAGKDRRGTLTLRATHQSGTVVLELHDDGRGLDRVRIGARAEAQGLVTDAAALTDEQLFALIFEPGFSTAAEVTAVSGRGVGMDVVRRHVESLRGTIDITSSPGRGTRFTIRLPLTVAIISGFTVGVGQDRYVLPLEAVEECVEFDVARAQGNGAEGMLSLRGAALPYLRLRDVLGLPGQAAGRTSVVVVRHGERRIGLVVDTLDGDCQAVIKPLQGALHRLPGIAGSTILGDGRVALILNVSQLIDIAAHRKAVSCCAP